MLWIPSLIGMYLTQQSHWCLYMACFKGNQSICILEILEKNGEFCPNLKCFLLNLLMCFALRAKSRQDVNFLRFLFKVGEPAVIFAYNGYPEYYNIETSSWKYDHVIFHWSVAKNISSISKLMFLVVMRLTSSMDRQYFLSFCKQSLISNLYNSLKSVMCESRSSHKLRGNSQLFFSNQRNCVSFLISRKTMESLLIFLSKCNTGWPAYQIYNE